MVAVRDVTENEIIISERALSFVPVQDAVRKTSNICSNCAAIILIPQHTCLQCYAVIYCSQECQLVDTRLHRFECPGFERNLWSLGIAHFAFRTMLRLVFFYFETYEDPPEVDNFRRLRSNLSEMGTIDLHPYAMVGGGGYLIYFLIFFTFIAHYIIIGRVHVIDLLSKLYKFVHEACIY